jgi:hypothetical protein
MPAQGIEWWDGLRLFVEVGLPGTASVFSVWDTATWDAAVWGGDDTWTDVSQWVRSIRTRRRFARDEQVWETGEAEVTLDNRDGRFSPLNLAGPYVAGGVTQIRPWRPVRIRARYADVIYSVFRGYVTDWQGSHARANADATMTMSCVDEQARWSLFDGFEQASQGGGETAGRRIHRVLDNVSYSGDRAIDSGESTMQPTTLAEPAVTELKAVTDSEGGALWVEADGSVVFEGRFALIENTRSNTVQATFGDEASDWLPYHDFADAYNGDLVVNITEFARRDGVSQRATDEASRSQYGDLEHTRTDLWNEADSQVLSLAQWYVRRFAEPEERVTSITLTPRANPAALFPQALGRRVRDLVTVVRRYPQLTERDCFIAGIAHTFEPGGDWSCVFELTSATPYQQFASSRWDVGVWDGSEWFF